MAVITISRQYGSMGDEIAFRICKMLGYRYFNKKLMAQVASEVDLVASDIVDFSEDNYKVQNFLERLFNMMHLDTQIETWKKSASGALTEEVEALDETKSIRMIEATIRAAYKHGNVVIVGRGGQVVLKDQPGVLHVRIETPLAVREQRLHKLENFSLVGAKDMAIKRDRAAADYLKRFYDVDWADPGLYDLVINTNKFRVEEVTELIIKAVSYLPVVSLSR
jgi:cytidylate kinase